MKIAFIVGSLDPGCDGVGDYARALAAELIRQGHGACVISLADRRVDIVAECSQESCGTAVAALRIPDSLPWEERVSVVRGFMQRAGVSHVSFQFVPYSYSPKGVIRAAVPFLLRVAEGRKIHVMFHELWIGNHIGARLKDRVVGALQRHYLLRFLRKLSPAVVHTTNPAYAAFLARDGIKVEILPLFGNISVAPDPGMSEALGLFRDAGIDLSTLGRPAHWVGGIFGSIHPEWNPDLFFSELAAVAAREKKSVVIAGMGRFGAKGDQIWAETVRTWSDRFRFALLGPLEVERLSHVFRVLDFGISTAPWRNFGKSSVGASMTDHGLPVIATRDDWRPRLSAEVDYGARALLQRYEPGKLDDFPAFLARRREPASTCPSVAKRFTDAVFGS